jgi:hypothetical protein
MDNLKEYIEENYGSFIDVDTVVKLMMFSAQNKTTETELKNKLFVCDNKKKYTSGQLVFKTGYHKRTIKRLKKKCDCAKL